MSHRLDPRETLGLLLTVVRSEGLGLLAAAIAYYAFVSLVPLVILGLSIATFFGGETFSETVAAMLAGVLTPEAIEILETALESDTGRGGATALGLVVLSWSGLRFFRGLHAAFARIYGTTETTSIIDELSDAVAAFGAIAISLASLSVIITIVRTAVPGGPILAPLGTALFLPIAFFPLYYLLPDVDITLLEAVPGAILAGFGWTLLGWGFTLYTTYAGTISVYGAIGVVFLALTWFYAGAFLILLGAVLNAVRAGRIDNRQLQQVAGRDSD